MDIWHKLNNNNWIYVLSQTSKLSVECQNNSFISESDIVGTGLLSLPNKCTGYVKGTQLLGKNYLKIELKTIETDFNLINDSCCNYLKFNQIQPNLYALDLKNLNVESLKEYDNFSKIQLIKHLNNLIEKPHIVTYGNYYSYTTIFITFILLIYFIFVISKCKICKGLYPCPRSNASPPHETPETPETELTELQCSSPRLRPT